MKPAKATISIASLIASGMLGVDAMVYSGEVLPDRVEQIAGEQVEIKQVGNVVEANAPWKDQPGIKVKYDLGETTVAERMADRRKNEIIYERVDFGDGGFKIDVLLNEKPDTNVFCYAIEGAENYDFFYQPPLTPEEIAEGAVRPTEIEGSYAVYHKTLKNHRVGAENYATGKVMHIPRPQVWELGNEANKVWADLSYDNGTLCVTAPQDFIDNADYTNGVRIDPTFGYTSNPGSSSVILCWETGDSSRTFGITGADYTLTENGVTQSISLATTNSGAESVDITGFIYTENSAGSGSHDLLVSGERQNYAVNNNSFTHIDLPGTEIAQGTSYIIAAACNAEDIVAGGGLVGLELDSTGSNSNNDFFESTGGVGSYATRVAENPWTENESTTTARYGIYVTYTPLPTSGQRINNGTIRLNNGTLDL